MKYQHNLKDDDVTISDMAFGNASSNSYVFVGGLPSWYGGDVAGIENVVLPTVLLEPRFRGGIRKLAYKDARMNDNTALNSPYSLSKKSRLPLQDLIAYKVRKNLNCRSAFALVQLYKGLFNISKVGMISFSSFYFDIPRRN